MNKFGFKMKTQMIWKKYGLVSLFPAPYHENDSS